MIFYSFYAYCKQIKGTPNMRFVGLLAVTVVSVLSLSAYGDNNKLPTHMDHMLHTNVLISIKNITNDVGFFDVCDKPPTKAQDNLKNAAKCSIPEPVSSKNISAVFVPKLERAYPVFVTENENIYTCRTRAAPTKPLYFSTKKGFKGVLVIGPYILDKNNKKIAVSCSKE
jgi:hypothetical protein